MEKENKFFKNHLSDLEVKPSIDVWDKIDNQLDQSAEQSKRAFFIRIAASISLLMISSFIVFQLLLGDNNQNSASNKSNTNQETILDSNQNKVIENKIALNDNQDEEEENEVIEEEIIEENPNTSKSIRVNNSENKQKKIEKDDKGTIEKKENTRKEKVKSSYHQNIEINSIDRFGSTEKDSLENSVIKVGSDVIQKEEVLLAENTKRKSRSVTIILEPIKKEDNQELLAMNETEDKKAWKKIRKAMSKDLYKQKINLGSIPKVELNKFKLGSN